MYTQGNPLYREILYKGKSPIQRHPIRIFIYIYIYVKIHRESYTKKSLTKGNPLYRDIPKGKSLVKGPLVKRPL